MAVRNCKDIACVAATVLLCAFLVAAQCENATKATMSSDPAHSPGLERIKPLAFPKNPNVPAEHPNEHVSSNENMDEEQKRIQMQMEKESEKLTNNHDDNRMATVGSQKKVNSHGPESRSNSSSSAESVEPHSSTHPLFADRHQEDASGTAVLVNPDSNSNSEIVHEHVEKYQLHQSSEQDSDEDSSFKAPTTTTSGGKVSDSMVVTSDSFPVRLEQNGKGSVSGNNGISAIRKPLPIVRQEAAKTHVSDTHENIHDQYIF